MGIYNPSRCSHDNCPYYTTCNQQGNIIKTISNKRKVKRIAEKNYYSLEEAVAELKQSLEQAYRSIGSGIHLIKAQTSIGKTTQYIDLIAKHPESKFLIALPTNILKKQVKEDLVGAGIPKEDIFMTVSLSDDFMFRNEWEIVKKAYKRGDYSKKKKVLEKLYNGIKDDINKKAYAELCKKHIDGISALKDERVLVTTHAFLFHISEDVLSRYIVIIDEDILLQHVFSQTHEIRVSILENVIEQNIPEISNIANYVMNYPMNKYGQLAIECNFSNLTEEQMDELGCCWDDNINDLKHAKSFVRIKEEISDIEKIKYFCPFDFPKLKYIILSATVNANIYQQYFYGLLPVYFYPVKMAKYKGKVIQYTYHSLGRRDLSAKMQVFDIARKKANNNNKLEIITFKEGISIKNVANMNSFGLYYGNTMGINALSGKDIGIIGTPYKTEDAYKLIACFLGADVNADKDNRPRPRRVEYNGYSFYITTYQDKILKEIQLYNLESELEQAIGRARLLRHSCNVYVFSSFPCEQAELHMENYLIDGEIE